MGMHHLIVIRDSGCSTEQADRQARSVLDAHSPCRTLCLHHATIDEVLDDPACLDPRHLAWVRVDQPDAGRCFELFGELQDRHIPTLLSRPAAAGDVAGALPQDGFVACPADTPPKMIGAMLQALRSQVSVLNAMRSELKLLHAHQGGLCDQIGRIDEELRLAAQLQREFLPKSLVSMGEVDFRVLFRPAGYVSGDIYDVVRLDEKHIGFFIADAVGHGVPAALLTMFIKRSLITKKIDPDSPRGYRLAAPGEALAKLNHDMVENQGGRIRFATAVYGVINCETREVCIARAGHPFPILLRASGGSEQLEPDGGLLGVFAEEEFEQICVTLEPGDRLLLYSDGFEMAFPSESDTAIDGTSGNPRKAASNRYLQEFEDLRRGSLDDVLGRLEGKLDTQVGSLNQGDDLTLLCVAAEPAAEPALAAAVCGKA